KPRSPIDDRAGSFGREAPAPIPSVEGIPEVNGMTAHTARDRSDRAVIRLYGHHPREFGAGGKVLEGAGEKLDRAVRASVRRPIHVAGDFRVSCVLENGGGVRTEWVSQNEASG